MTISTEIYNNLIEENQYLREQFNHYKEIAIIYNKALDDLINNIICLCAEGPDVMKTKSIYEELIADAKKAREVLEESW